MSEQTLFIEALDRPAEERAAFLESACAGDVALRERIGRLLVSYDQAADFMAQPALVPPVADFPGPNVVEQIGPYRVIRQLGEGGMGIVFLAEQEEPVRRTVALKVIRPGLDTRQVIARFEAERQALALMDHPNIARVLDAGTTATGRPYFVMELVQGIPITRYCDEQRLTPRERLTLFLPVCQALQHAHQKGIIHRDLKPSNVLVALYDGRPAPKVIDFGVAKATGPAVTERTLVTELGQVVGTLEYMSPEQAELNQLDIDTRSDIYSLGVLLYELLTGTTPFQKQELSHAALLDMLRVIRESEPPKPSARLSGIEALPSIAVNRSIEPWKLTTLLRGELDWVVMKALDKDRNRRYETAGGLALDVQRYLADEPVQACPPSILYRLRKLTRRNRVAISSSALVLTALVVGTIVSVTQAIRARNSEWQVQQLLDKQVEINAELVEERQRAQSNFRRARQAVDDMYTQLAEKWLVNQPKMEGVTREFLEKALQYYSEFAAEAGNDPAIRLEAAQAYRRLGDIQHRLGNASASGEPFEKAVERLQALVDEFPQNADYRQALAETLHQFGALLTDTGRYQAEQKAHRRALEIQSKLAAEFPDSRRYQQDLARGHWHMGECLESASQFAESEREYRSAISIQTALAEKFPAKSEYRENLADSYVGMSTPLIYQGKGAACRQALHDAVKILEQLVAESPAIPRHRNALADAHYQLALVESPPQREHYIRLALANQEKLVSEFPSFTDLRYDLFRSYELLGSICEDRGRRDAAEEAFRHSISIGEKLAVEAPTVHYYRSRLGLVYLNYAEMLEHAQRREEALEVFRKAFVLHESLVTDFPEIDRHLPRLISATRRYGQLLIDSEKFEDSLPVLERWLALEPDSSRTLSQRAMNLAMNSRPDSPGNTFAHELAVRVARNGPQIAEVQVNLGVAFYRTGDYQAAVDALEVSELASGSMTTPGLRFILAMAHARLHHVEKAQQAFDREVREMEGRNNLPPSWQKLKAEAEEVINASRAP